MKCSLTASVILLSMGLSACSLSVDEPPIARQSQDLKDPDSDGVINARDNCVETPLVPWSITTAAPTICRWNPGSKCMCSLPTTRMRSLQAFCRR